MVEQARLSAGEQVLIHAAGSGVGTAALQVAGAIGARALGTTRTSEKLARAKEYGLPDGIVVQGGRFADEVMARTGGRGVDVVVDLVGGAYVPEDLACLAPRGRIVVVGAMAGIACELNLSLLMHKRAEVRGTVLRARPLEEKILAGRALQIHIAPLFESGRLRPVVDRVLPLERAGEAHAIMQSNETFGKIVLQVA
jgi:NADPH:quinone reductase-like Zn-dependent oxidoreductase